MKFKNHLFHLNPRCVVIGTTHMCISILELLYKHNWNVLYVVSKDPDVAEYCKKNKLEIVNELNQVKKSNFILFSVVNYKIISFNFLKSHKVFYAINYHDSLLPKYGGINSTTWAIYNKEPLHGVSWHLISSKIDEGAIIKQSSFTIHPNETAFSLNLKCLKEGIKLFNLLLNDIESDSLTFKKQNLSKKTYFGKNEIPENYGIIDFKDNFEKIDRLSRCLYLGGENYNNPVGNIKIWDGKNVFLFKIKNFMKDKKSIPGKVYCSNFNNSISIGINDGILIITDIKTPEGEKIDIENTNFQKNEIIPSYHLNQAEKNILKQIKKHEDILINKFYLENSSSNPLFPTKLIYKKNSILYRQCLSFNKENYNSILERIFITLFNLIGKNARIPVKSEVKINSKFLKQFLFQMSLIDLNKFQKDLNYNDFVHILQQELDEYKYIPKDLFHRYHINNFHENLEIVISNKPLSKQSLLFESYRIRIIVTNNHIYIDGYEQDKAIINLIYSSLKNIIDNMLLTKNINIKHYITNNINNEKKTPSCFEARINPKRKQKDSCHEPSPNILEMFEEKSLYHPEALALIVKDQKFSYRYLNEKSNQFARYLKTKGVLPGSLVAIGIDRSFELIVAMLGVIKAGCTYLPIDPSHPPQRIHFILQDAQVDCIITKYPLKKRFNNKGQENFIFIDKEQSKISQQPKTNLKRNIKKDQLAYVIYTSGSTGQPKGVEIFESSVNNLIHSVQERIQSTPEDRWLALTTISFDISNLEIFLPLTQGASIILATKEDAKNPHKIIKLINNYKITKIQATPSLWQMIIDSQWKGKKGLTILCGGESLSKSLAQKLLRLGINLWNMYGPTETTIWSSMEQIIPSKEKITIGKPINNTSFYILDEQHQIQPSGIPGELYIGGSGLARGYRNRQELTKSKFIDSPYGKLYKTGDLVRHLPDEGLEYIGRLDHQVKIRGFRIELGEIEETLKKVAGIEQVVATTYEIKPGDIRLAVYFKGSASKNDLKSAASTFLPSYMQPNVYMKIKKFPLTPNQKINRNALPVPKDIDDNDKYIAPRNLYEEKIVKIFEDHLGIKNLSVNANFFSHGGHSLLVAQVISEINKMFYINLPLSILFEYPTVISLSLEVQCALNYGNNIKPLIRESRKKAYELSPSQLRIWFDEQMTPHTSLYSVPQILEIFGKLEISKFQRSLKKVFQKHEILQAIFKIVNGEIKQIIQNKMTLPFQYLDYSNEINPKNKAKHKISSVAKKSFNLVEGPLSQFILIRLSSTEYLFFFNFHHIIFDGLSTNLFIQDILNFYEDKVDTKNRSPLNQIPQYVDYISWQRKNVKETNAGALNYLKEKLKNIPLTPFLPTDKSRLKHHSRKGNHINFSIKQSQLKKIHAFIKENNTTLFVFMLALFHIVLSRYGSRKKIVIGTPFSERNNIELNSMIGCFINIMPILTSSKEHETFLELLNRFNTESIELLKHPVPFEQLIKELKIERSTEYFPVFQVMINMLPKIAIEKMDNLKLNLQQIDRGMSHFDLSLTFQESSKEMIGIMEYNSELFNKSTIKKIIQHFLALLKIVLQNPHKKVSQYQFLSHQEIQKQLTIWNKQEIKYDRTKTILESIEEHAANTPQKIAIVCGTESLTYEALNNEANKIAHMLIKNGVQCEDKIVVCLERSKDFIVAILGILKSGAAYVPIDPLEPKDRIKAIFHNLRPVCVITHEKIKIQFPLSNILYIQQINCSNTNNPKIKIFEDQLAYVIYTSGSTGQPKGVEIEHRSINDRVMWKKSAYPLSSNAVMLHTYSFIFDGAIINYFWPLCIGSSLIIATSLEQYDPASLAKLIQKHHVSVTDMLPSLIHGLIETNDFKKCTSLKYVFSGGEALASEIVRIFYKNCSWAKLYNTYGPTEATVEASVWECKPKFLGSISPIGKPIAGAKLYVLDNELNLLPLGVPGELYIGGEGLARSYLNDQKLTNAKFVNNPFNKGRLYRTGDLVKYNTQGDLIFLGRIDNQVKIRGYRVELGEIESSLLYMDQVERAAVIIKGSGAYKKIIAYVQLHPRIKESSFQPLAQHFLKKRLPKHMIPSQYVIMDKIPTLLNGKVNYKELSQSSEIPYVHHYSNLKAIPSCTKEIQLLNIWKKILDFVDLSINDNFFDVGGNSLLAIKLIVTINKEMNISLSPAILFRHPTIKSLALFIKKPIEEKKRSLIVSMKDRGEKNPFFCIHPIGGNVFCYKNLAKHWREERPFYAIQAKGLEKKEQSLTSIPSMAKEYIKSIKKIQPKGPYIIGGWSFGGHVATEIVRQLVKINDEVEALVLIDTSTEIDKFRKIDINNENLLYSELVDHYNVNITNEYKNLSSKEKLFQLLERGNTGTDISSLEKDNLKYILNVVKSNYSALQKFYISPINHIPTILLRAQYNSDNSHDLGWQKYVDKLHIYDMPGNHWGIVYDNYAKAYADVIQASLNILNEKEILITNLYK